MAKNIKRIPVRIFSKGKKLSWELIKLTEKIIIGILNIITIIEPRKKFVLFKRFIEEEIDPKQDKAKDPIKKLNINIKVFWIDKLIKILAIGIEIKNGICTKTKWEIILNKEIIS